MTDYDDLVSEFIARFPHLVLEMTGPWRDRSGKMLSEPWICNFKNASLGLQGVHSGSAGHSMSSALEAGLDYLGQHAESAEVRDYEAVTDREICAR